MQRVAAYAVILRTTTSVLLSRLSSQLTSKELWTLPGGGLEHGEDPRDAVVREVHEETGLDVEIGETAHVYSFHQRNTWRQGRRADAHSLRIVYDGWVPVDAPEPRVVEVDGSTAEAAWKPLADVLDGTVPTVSLVTEVLERAPVAPDAAGGGLRPGRARDGPESCWSATPPRARTRAAGRCPAAGSTTGSRRGTPLVREVAEETGLACEVGDVLDGHRLALRGHRALGAARGLPHRRRSSSRPRSTRGRAARSCEPDGTTDAVAWVPLDRRRRPVVPGAAERASAPWTPRAPQESR